ncbi:NUDIX hydrolase [Candidatus Nomurabacteria bacterium]|nr:NUDIX hydrolase [Candidatus Nomurabacteria bacterium]
MLSPDRRQVASIVLLNPAGKALCLTMSERATQDGRLNLSPLQGGIEKNESLYSAVVREVREEIGVGVSGKVLYLGSAIRTLGPDHKRRDQFKEYHHHWVVTFADSYTLSPQPPLLLADWYYFDTLKSISHSMSESKRQMLQGALTDVFRISGDHQLVRREAIISARQTMA